MTNLTHVTSRPWGAVPSKRSAFTGSAAPITLHGGDTAEVLGDARRWILVQTHYGIDVYEVRGLRGSGQAAFDCVASVACDEAARDVVAARKARFAAPVSAEDAR